MNNTVINSNNKEVGSRHVACSGEFSRVWANDT